MALLLNRLKEPTEEQGRAVDAIKTWYKDKAGDQIFLLDGAAGVGKTTTAAFCISALNARRVICGAYTAKAALVLRRKGLGETMTIHQMVYRFTGLNAVTGQPNFELNKDGPAASADLIVIDEVSMVNQVMAGDLKSFKKKILVLGDVENQLPPIEGAGAFLSRPPDFRLIEPNRFAMESPIFRLADRIRRGAPLPCPFSDGAVMVRSKAQAEMERLLAGDTQTLCGTHDLRRRLTHAMRKASGFSGERVLVGEKLICIRNDHRQGLYNGAFAEALTAAALVGDAAPITVLMEDGRRQTGVCATEPFRRHFRPSMESEPPPRWKWPFWFDWGYAVTVHKAQGSEWPNVVVFDESRVFHDPDTRRRWLYTALTRAADTLTIYV